MKKTADVKPNMKLQWASLRCVIALLGAGIMLYASGFGILDLLGKPLDPSEVTGEKDAYVSTEINMIIGFCAEQVRNDEVLAQYGLVHLGDEYIVVRFTGRYIESAEAVCDSTYEYINKQKESLDKYIRIKGTFTEISDEVSEFAFNWFEANHDQLVLIGAIYDTEDYSAFISDYMIEVDTINGISQSKVISFTVIAGILILYILVEMFLMLRGFYLPPEFKPEKKVRQMTVRPRSKPEFIPAAEGETNFYENFLENYSGARREPEAEAEAAPEAESAPEEGSSPAEGGAADGEEDSGV